MIVGKSVPRVDAYDKVTGRAKYTDDLVEKNALIGKILHSTIANGLVTKMDIEEAMKIPGVVKIVTCFDVPNIPFPTAGHPWSTDPHHQDPKDQLFRKLYMARFTRTAQTLLSTGVAMLDTLHISGEATNNTIVQRSIENAAEKVKGGKPLSTAIKDQEYILPLVPQMSRIGEQSGKMDEMMGKAAQVYEDEVDEQIRTISTLIEPVLMVLLAVMAGGMIGAILFPIYGLVNSV